MLCQVCEDNKSVVEYSPLSCCTYLCYHVALQRTRFNMLPATFKLWNPKSCSLSYRTLIMPKWYNPLCREVSWYDTLLVLSCFFRRSLLRPVCWNLPAFLFLQICKHCSNLVLSIEIIFMSRRSHRNGKDCQYTYDVFIGHGHDDQYSQDGILKRIEFKFSVD